MAKKLPEMLYNWNAFERTFNEIIKPIKDLDANNMCVDPELWEDTVRRIDQAVAAATCRGEQLPTTPMYIVDEVWDMQEKNLEFVKNRK